MGADIALDNPSDGGGMLPLELLLCDVISVEEPFCDECFPPLIASKQEQQAPIVNCYSSHCEGFATSYCLRRSDGLLLPSATDEQCSCLALASVFCKLQISNLFPNVRTLRPFAVPRTAD